MTKSNLKRMCEYPIIVISKLRYFYFIIFFNILTRTVRLKGYYRRRDKIYFIFL